MGTMADEEVEGCGRRSGRLALERTCDRMRSRRGSDRACRPRGETGPHTSPESSARTALVSTVAASLDRRGHALLIDAVSWQRRRETNERPDASAKHKNAFSIDKNR